MMMDRTNVGEGLVRGEEAGRLRDKLRAAHARASTLANAERDTCLFVPVPHTAGYIALWHFPSKQQLKIAKELGCAAVVTLQSDSENVASVSRACEELGMAWIQLDFWKHFLPREKNVNIVTLADDLIVRLQAGAKIMIHCAAGVHRTGSLSYIILRRLGMPSKEAYEYLGTLRPVTRKCVGDHRIETAEAQFSKWFASAVADDSTTPSSQAPAAGHRPVPRHRAIRSDDPV